MHLIIQNIGDSTQSAARHMDRGPTAADFELADRTIGRCLRDLTLAGTAGAVCASRIATHAYDTLDIASA